MVTGGTVPTAIRVPPSRTKGAVPRAVFVPADTVPETRTALPVKALAPPRVSVAAGELNAARPNGPSITPPRVSEPRPTATTAFAPRVSGLLMAAAPTVTVPVTAGPIAAASPTALPPTAKSPAGDTSITSKAILVSPTMSFNGAKPLADAEKPGALVSNESRSPLSGARPSSQLAGALHKLPPAPEAPSQCSVAGVTRSSRAVTPRRAARTVRPGPRKDFR